MAERAQDLIRRFAVLTPLVVTIAMLGVRSLTNTPSVLVPEAAALSAGMLLWRLPLFTHRPLAMVALIVLDAFWGVELARYLVLPEPLLIAVALSGILLGFALFDVPALPALSAGLLPIYLHTTSAWYVVAVGCTMVPAALVAQRWPRPARQHFSLRASGEGALALAPLAGAAGLNPFLALPPLYVLVVEGTLSATPPAVGSLVRRLATVLTGFVSALALRGHLPALAIGVVATTVTLLVATALAQPIPPALSFSLVPLLFPVTSVPALAFYGTLGAVVATGWPAVLIALALRRAGAGVRLAKSARTSHIEGSEETS